MKIQAIVWKKLPGGPGDEFDVLPWKSLPWRAAAACPFTGQAIRAAGDCESGAMHALGRAFYARIKECCSPGTISTFSLNLPGLDLDVDPGDSPG